MESKKPSNIKAFPNEYNSEDGMTLRDYFANSAMQGVLSNDSLLKSIAKQSKNDNENSVKNIAKYSYQIADEMLKQSEP